MDVEECVGVDVVFELVLVLDCFGFQWILCDVVGFVEQLLYFVFVYFWVYFCEVFGGQYLCCVCVVVVCIEIDELGLVVYWVVWIFEMF